MSTPAATAAPFLRTDGHPALRYSWPLPGGVEESPCCIAANAGVVVVGSDSGRFHVYRDVGRAGSASVGAPLRFNTVDPRSPAGEAAARAALDDAAPAPAAAAADAAQFAYAVSYVCSGGLPGHGGVLRLALSPSSCTVAVVQAAGRVSVWPTSPSAVPTDADRTDDVTPCGPTSLPDSVAVTLSIPFEGPTMDLAFRLGNFSATVSQVSFGPDDEHAVLVCYGPTGLLPGGAGAAVLFDARTGAMRGAVAGAPDEGGAPAAESLGVLLPGRRALLVGSVWEGTNECGIVQFGAGDGPVAEHHVLRPPLPRPKGLAPAFLALNASGTVAVVGAADGRTWAIDTTTGADVGLPSVQRAPIPALTGLAFGATGGHTYWAGTALGELLLVNSSGGVLWRGGAATVGCIADLAVDTRQGGNADDDGTVYTVDPAGYVARWATPPSLARVLGGEPGMGGAVPTSVLPFGVVAEVAQFAHVLRDDTAPVVA